MRRLARPLLYLGVLGIVFGLAQVHARYIGHYSFAGSSRFSWTVLYAALLSVFAYGFGLPDMPRTKRAAVGASVGAAFAGALSISVVQLFVGDALLPRFVVFGSALLLPDWYRICVGFAVGGRSRAEARDRVAVVASPDEIAALAHELQASPERPAAIIARYSIADARERGIAALPGEALPTVVVLDRAAQEVASIVADVAALHEQGVRVRSMTLFYEEWLGKLPISELERASLLFDIGEVHRVGYGRAKRIIDVMCALLGCAALVLVLPIVLIGNSVGNRGALVYRQDRIGKGGRAFSILKFRTMSEVPSGGGTSEWTTVNDPRVTPFGRVLRSTHLDELPQMVNILRGDLSLVGPRPEQPHYVEELTEKLPFYPLRHLVRPGLTGWAQVKYGYAGSEADALEKLQYEFFYLRKQSLLLDLRIMGRTVRSVLGTAGR